MVFADTEGLWGLFSGFGVPEDDGPPVKFAKHGNSKSGYGKWGHVARYEDGRPYLVGFAMSDPVERIHEHHVDLCRVVTRCYGFKIADTLLGLAYTFGVTDHIREQRWRSAGKLTYRYSLQCACSTCPCPRIRMLSSSCFLYDAY